MLLPSSATVAEVGEAGLLQIIKQFCGSQVGDDGAVLGATLPGSELVVTTDMLVEGVHFSDRTTSAADVGWRAAAANLSDLAAMGASPWGLTIALGLPPYTPVAWVEGLYQGFRACLYTYGGEIIGGDLVRAATRQVAVTALGQVQRDRLIQRSTAQVGDQILISGSHGNSRAGLELLLNPQLAHNLDQAQIHRFYQAHQRPVPRFDLIQLLAKLPPTKITGMDSSDGLGDALSQICAASKVGAKLNWQNLPIPRGIELIAPHTYGDWIINGGEDFELVLTLDQAIAQQVCQLLPGTAIIGEIVAEPGIIGIELGQGFQHFS
ncbi:MAG: thiamine-phosphate kinase [Pseudanabaenaceae cyanobacterium bins.68]|nr:thiamine-phosphate kinase [Pseudanabaenaceae cyanobacterium bins.68]